MEAGVASAELRRQILARARADGFDAVGFAAPDAAPEAGARLDQFLAQDRHGDMDWMATTAERRAHPRRLWPEVRSIIVLGVNYAPAGAPLAVLEARDKGAISIYARRRDYHDVIKKRLKRLGRWIHREFGAEIKVFVDTAPVMEKPLAAAAGLGWQGKHTNLVSRQYGSWLFLGEIFTTLDLPPDAPEPDHCGGCRRCLDICPTKAFPAPYQLDARRCISYLTIEHKGPIAPEFRTAIGNRIFGCDDCLAVCPWNKFAQTAHDAALALRPEFDAPDLAELAALDEDGFRARFRGTPVRRLGRARLLRNVLIAIGNSGRSDLAPCAERLLRDASPLVRAMAVWALARLAPDRCSTLAAQHPEQEDDADVRAEWRAALSAPASTGASNPAI